jgi:hypothetical protein
MALALIRRNGIEPEQLSVYDGELKVGRIYKAGKVWCWEVDWFGFGRKLMAELRGSGMQDTGDALFRQYWFWVVRSGLEKRGKGHAATREQAMADFRTAWKIVTEAGRETPGLGESAALQT